MERVESVLDDTPPASDEYTLVVAIANPANLDQLMRTATDLATANAGEVRVVSVIHKPINSPFRFFSDEVLKEDYDEGRQSLLDDAVALAEEESVPVSRSLLVGSDVATAIESVIEDVTADALLLGWHDRVRSSDVILGTTVDPLIRQAPCDIYVERVGATADGMDKILLPTAGGDHIQPATDLAGAVARANDATVSVISYVDPDPSQRERDAAKDFVDSATSQLDGVTVEKAVEERRDIADAIIERASNHDFVILGATRERRFRNPIIGSVAEAVARQASPPIVITKQQQGGSFLQRIIGWR